MNLEVIYSAAHAEFPDTEPLGGGKAVADYLIREWRTSEQFRLTVLSPKSLRLAFECGSGVPAAIGQTGRGGDAAPTNRKHNRRFTAAPLQPRITKPLADLTEFGYARFCRQFERAVTSEILKHDPQTCVVLSNDISEGPDFASLGQRGYRIVTIFHVDVVEYFTKFYLRNFVPPERLAKFRWFGVMPDVLRLVFQKQHECVRHSLGIVVPSVPMKEMIRRCYPWCPAEKITVLPWGNISAKAESVAAVPREGSALIERRYNVGDDEFVILTLSRLSPEKGIERLLRALPLVRGKFRVFICGGAAYMKGRAYERKLRRLAAKIKTARADFTSHVTGMQKATLLQRADLFISPSLHESYGLTIAEAEAAGCRVISHNHYGAGGTVVDCSDPVALAAAINAILATGRTQKIAQTSPPSGAAQHLAEFLAVTSPSPCLH